MRDESDLSTYADECGTGNERDFGPTMSRFINDAIRATSGAPRALRQRAEIATQIARREPARFRDRPVPVAHKRPDRTCPGLPVHATRARF
jgi:hypothetical protein